jgi:hypothetical protein
LAGVPAKDPIEIHGILQHHTEKVVLFGSIGAGIQQDALHPKRSQPIDMFLGGLTVPEPPLRRMLPQNSC